MTEESDDPPTDEAPQDEGEGEASMSEELNPEIGLVGALAIGVGTMIAAGIFVLSGLAVEKVGAVAIGSFLIAAVIAGFTAAAYAEFSSIYQESGGGYMYVANTFDSNITYIMGWTMILGYPASAAFYLASFSDWFFRFIYPPLNIPDALPFWIPGIGVLALLVFVNLKGTEESSQFQIVVTALKVALLLLFLFGGLQALDPAVVQQSVTENIDQFAQIGLTSALVFITFFGFSAIATNAEEIKDPGRTIPRAIYLSMGIVTVIYALVVLVIVIAVNSTGFKEFLAANVDLGGKSAAEFIATHGEVSMGYAARYYLDIAGNLGFYVIIVGALFSMLSAANATIMAGSRVKLAMARRNHLPASFEDIHPTWGTPYRTVLLTGGLIFVYIVVFAVIFGESPGGGGGPPFGLHLGIEGLAQFANFLLITGLSIVNVALVVSRRKYPDMERGFRVPLVPVVPAIAVLANLVLLVNVGVVAFAIGLLAELIGVGFWFAWKSRSPSVDRIEEETPTAVAEYTGPSRDYQIVVPIANPRSTEQLMRTATTLAKQNDGEVLVMSVVTVPDQTPLSRGREKAEDKRAVIDRAMEIAEREDVPVSGTVRIGHHAADAIVNTVARQDSDAVLLGWGGERSGRRDVVLGSRVDRVVAEADCDVYVQKIGVDTGDPGVGSVLLPTAGGPHAELAAEVAGAIARGTGTTVHAINVVDPGAPEEKRERARALLDAAADSLGDVDVESRIVEDDDVVDAIVEASNEHDLTVIGATREGFLQKFLFGAIPEAVGERAAGSVIMTKRDLDVRSRLQQSVDKFRERVSGRSETMERDAVPGD